MLTLDRIAARSLLDTGYCYRCRDLAWSVHLLVTTVNPAKTAEPLKMLFGSRHVGPKEPLLDGLRIVAT